MIRDVGDVVALKLTVTPAAPDTATTVTVTAPNGANIPTTPTSNAERTIWSANLLVTLAGVYHVHWTVTGTGAGAEHYEVRVRPTAPQTGLHTYATTTDLANHLHDAPPPDAARMLARASAVLDSVLIGARYLVDVAGLPTDPATVAALRDATCAQVAWWSVTGDETGAGAGWDSVSIGSVTLSRGAGAGRSSSRWPR